MLPFISFWLYVYVNGVFIIRYPNIYLKKKKNINNYLSVPQSVA